MLGKAHQTEHHTEDGTDADRSQSNGQGISQAAQIELPAILKEKRLVELCAEIGKTVEQWNRHLSLCKARGSLRRFSGAG